MMQAITGTKRIKANTLTIQYVRCHQGPVVEWARSRRLGELAAGNSMQNRAPSGASGPTACKFNNHQRDKSA